MNASRFLLLSMVLSPILFGQKKDELVSIQRDVADLADQVKQLRKGLDDKVAALTALMQQSIDASNKTAAAMAAMQRDMEQKMAEQQTKLVAPLATVGTKVDEMSGDMRSVQTAVVEMRRKVNDIDDKVKDISDTLRIMSAQTPGPPPPSDGNGVVRTTTPDVPPPGMSADMSYNAAYNDYMGKKDEIALDEFTQYLKYFGQTSNAPNAWYFIGQIYYRTDHWEDAAKAFDTVLEKFPKNPKTAESQYLKACALMNWKGHKNEAVSEFKSFIANYPAGSPHVADAHKHLRELGMEAPGTHRK